MNSKEAFERWWLDSHGGNWFAYYTISEKDNAEEGWQAACAYQKQKDALICMGLEGVSHAEWIEGTADCSLAILNQGDE